MLFVYLLTLFTTAMAQCPSNWAALTATTLSAVAPSCFNFLSAKDVGKVPANACSGFTSAQITALNGANSCSGFQSACISNINATAFTPIDSCLSKLTNSALAAISSAQLANVPADSFDDFASFGALTSTACAGFTTLQVKKFSAYTTKSCSSISSACFSNIVPTRAAAMTSDCFTALSTATVGAFSSAFVNATSAALWSDATANILAALPAPACAGFNTAQLKNIDSHCSSFKSACISNIPAPTMTGMTSDCFNKLSKSSLAAVSAAQLAKITPAAFAEFTGFNSLASAACAGFDALQVHKFADSYPYKQCAQMTSGCLSNIAAASLRNLTSGCLTSLSASSVAALSKQQIAVTAAKIWSSFTAFVSLTTTACAGFTNNQVAQFANDYPYKQCSGIASGCISNIPATSFRNISAECFQGLSKSAVGGFSAPQVRQVSAKAFSSFDKFDAFTSTACMGFQLSQTKQFAEDYNYKQCTSLMSGCVSNIPVSAMGGLTSACVSSLTTSALGGLNETQVAAIQPSAFSGFARFSSLVTTACKGFTQLQVAQFAQDYPYTQCQSVTSGCLSNMPPTSLRNFTTSCMSSLPASAVGGFSAAQVTEIETTGAWSAFKYFGSFVGDACEGFNKKYPQSEYFASDYPYKQCNTFNAQCSKHLTAKAMSGLTAGCFAAFPGSAVSVLVKTQVAGVSPTAWTSFSQFNYLNNTACTGFTAPQVAQLAQDYPYNQCNNFGAQCFANTDINVIAHFSNECLEKMKDWSKLNAKQLTTISPRLNSTSMSAVATFNPVACSGITDVGMKLLGSSYPYDACRGFSAACFNQTTLQALTAVQTTCFATLSPNTLVAIPLDKWLNFTELAISGITPEQLNKTITVHKKQFIERSPTFKIQSVPSSSITSFHFFAPNNIVQPYIEKITALSETQWLRTTFAVPKAAAALTIQDFAKATTLVGLSRFHAPEVTNLSGINQQSRLFNVLRTAADFVGALDAKQVAALNSTGLIQLSDHFTSLQQSAVQAIAPKTLLDAVSFPAFLSRASHWSCAFVLDLTSAQFDLLSTIDAATKQHFAMCKLNPVPNTTPKSGGTTDPHNPKTTTTSAAGSKTGTSPQKSSGKPPGPAGYYILLALVVFLAVVVVVLIVAFFLYRKRRTQGYTPV